MKQNIKLRQQLAITASELITMNEWNQAEAAKNLETTQSTISSLMRNDVAFLSMDSLSLMIEKMGGKVSFNIEAI